MIDINTDVLIEVQNISKTFFTRDESVKAIEEVSFDVKKGEFLAILGPSGCGKSTLMLIIAGLLDASHGEVYVSGKKVTEPQTDIGIVFQKPVLLDWRKTLGNVLIQVELRRLNPKDYEERALHLLQAAGLRASKTNTPMSYREACNSAFPSVVLSSTTLTF